MKCGEVKQNMKYGCAEKGLLLLTCVFQHAFKLLSFGNFLGKEFYELIFVADIQY